jgi:hypothetical protein
MKLKLFKEKKRKEKKRKEKTGKKKKEKKEVTVSVKHEEPKFTDISNVQGRKFKFICLTPSTQHPKFLFHMFSVRCCCCFWPTRP